MHGGASDRAQFLSFFRLGIKFTAITFLLQTVIMLPVHYRHTGEMGLPNPNSVSNTTTNETTVSVVFASNQISPNNGTGATPTLKSNEVPPSDAMLWLYVMFVYLFSALALYLLISHTKKIIKVRQAFLGGQSSITDKTIRLSGVPVELRSEEAIKETIEDLQIGKVDSVLLCKDWSELDDLLARRGKILQKLEASWATYIGTPVKHSYFTGNNSAAHESQDSDVERSRLLDQHSYKGKKRPKTRIWYGFLNLQFRSIDAIDYLEEKLRKLDENIKSSRKKVFKPTPLAFVTMDSTASAVSYRRR